MFGQHWCTTHLDATPPQTVPPTQPNPKGYKETTDSQKSNSKRASKRNPCKRFTITRGKIKNMMPWFTLERDPMDNNNTHENKWLNKAGRIGILPSHIKD
jgi:hypothetical protein